VNYACVGPIRHCRLGFRDPAVSRRSGQSFRRESYVAETGKSMRPRVAKRYAKEKIGRGGRQPESWSQVLRPT